MGGKPTIRGMRFSVGDILELLSSGLTDKDMLFISALVSKGM